MIEKELIIFTLITLIVIFFCKLNYRLFYLAYKIPTSKIDMSLKGIWKLFNADGVEAFKIITVGNDGPLTKTWHGKNLIVLATSPEDVKIVFTSKHCLDKPYFFQKCTGLKTDTVFGKIEGWHKHRKILSPFFGIQQVRSLIPLFNEKTRVLLETMSKMEGKGEFNVFHYMTTMSLETFLKLMEFDVDIQNHVEERDELIENLELMNSLYGLRVLKFWQQTDIYHYLSGNYAKTIETRPKTAEKYVMKIIENIQSKISEDIINNNNNDDDEKNAKSFIRELMHSKHNLPEKELYDEIDTLLLAAQDTSALVLSGTILLLAMYKDVQQKVYDELIKVFGKVSGDFNIDFDQINQLEYLEMAINESMRILPVVPYVFRTCSEEITSSEGYIIPAKTAIGIPIFNIHRNKKFWGEDALEFKPERFSKENISKIHPYQFIPFTKGQRMCLGWRYAMNMMKIQLAKILLNYKVDTKLKLNELTFNVGITLNFIEGYQVSIEKREF